MRIIDQNLCQFVAVYDEQCPKRKCYNPRPDPVSYGEGAASNSAMCCETREIQGCPDDVFTVAPERGAEK